MEGGEEGDEGEGEEGSTTAVGPRLPTPNPPSFLPDPRPAPPPPDPTKSIQSGPPRVRIFRVSSMQSQGFPPVKQ